MYANSRSTKKTHVKIFFTVIMFGSIAQQTYAAESDYRTRSGYDVAVSNCRDIQNQYLDAKKDIAKLCGDAGIKGDCEKKVKSCSDDAGDDGSVNNSLWQTAAALTTGNSTASTILGALGQSSNASKGCPQYSFQDYFDKKDKYQSDADDTKEKLATLTDDQATVQSDFNTKISDLQTDVDNANKDLNKTNREIDKSKRDDIATFAETQQKAAAALRQQGTQLLELRAQLINAQRNKAVKLIGMSEAAAKRSCVKTVMDMKQQYQKTGELNGLSQNNYLAKGNYVKQALIQLWNDCMSTYDQQRTALFEASKQEEDLINKKIQDTEEGMKDVQDSLDLGQSQMAAAQKEADDQKSEAKQNLVKMMQNTQNKMTAAKQELETKLQTIANKSSVYNQKINELNMKISQLGVVPPSSTTTPAKISGSLLANTDVMRDLEAQAAGIHANDPEMGEFTCTLGSEKSSSSRKSGRAIK